MESKFVRFNFQKIWQKNLKTFDKLSIHHSRYLKLLSEIRKGLKQIFFYCETDFLYYETDPLYCETDFLYCETDPLYCETDFVYCVTYYLRPLDRVQPIRI